ncbi:MAG: DNA mismatch repair endonuclease MutL [Fimbriimonadales bacterium]
MLGRVELLDAHTINQIAAGEVVERPSSAVKELIENALDAGASQIEIEIGDSGKSLIRVSDNGSGMTREDAELSLLRHATSKIRGFEDLRQTVSLGFRGEALPSIASVSRMTISTGVDDSGRTKIEVAFGERVLQSVVPGAKGTDIIVENLFGNTPARLKFLKSDTSETSAIVEVVSRYIIAFPQVAFRLRLGEVVAMSSAGSGDRLDALAAVWGKDLCRALAEIDTHVSGIRVTGFVAPPHVNKPTRAHQLLFVNGRPIRSRSLYAAIDAAYRSLTPERRYGVVALHLETDPAEVDVNVSPTKSEVKFQREGAAFDAVRLAIKSGLVEHGMMPTIAPSFVGSSLGGSSQGAVLEALAPTEIVHDLFQVGVAPLPTGERYPFCELLDDLKVLGQTLNTFIVASTRRGIVILDQHVAHERVLYEYLCGLKSGSAIEIQQLLSPETIEFEQSAAVSIGKQLDVLASVGFRMESFGANSFLLRTIPAAAAGKDYRKLLVEVADELVAAGGKVQPQDAREKIWIMSACRMAVKAGDPLSVPEMEHLIRELAETENPYMCPHGRPITVTFGYDELLRRFKRT